MSKIIITNRVLECLIPRSKPYFIRDSQLRGFGIKVNPSGSIKFVAETKCNGRSSRKTIGEYPLLDLAYARREAFSYIASVKTGQLTAREGSKPLYNLFKEYISITSSSTKAGLYMDLPLIFLPPPFFVEKTELLRIRRKHLHFKSLFGPRKESSNQGALASPIPSLTIAFAESSYGWKESKMIPITTHIAPIVSPYSFLNCLVKHYIAPESS